MLRLGSSLLFALFLSEHAAQALFSSAGLGSEFDRILLVVAPALAMAYLFFRIFPSIDFWLRGRRVGVLVGLCVPAVIGGRSLLVATDTVSPSLASWLAASLLMCVLMVPAAADIEKVLAGKSLPDYVVGFAAASFLVYLSVRLLDDLFQSVPGEACFAGALLLVGSVIGTIVVRRMRVSMRSGFLRRPLNLAASALPLTLMLSFAGLSSRIPGSFSWYWPTGRASESGLLVASATLAAVWGLWALHRIDSSALISRLQRNSSFAALNANLPGIYAAGVFFLTYLMIARAINHPALSLNTVIFESDAGPWMNILGSPDPESIGRAVHPLVLVLVRPMVRLLAVLLGEQWRFAPILAVAALSGLSVFLAWLFVRRATGVRSYALLWAILLGSTSTHLLFGSLTETYAFTMAALLAFMVLVQAKEVRFRALVPAGLLVFGITISNFAQAVLALLFSGLGWRRLARLCAVILAAGVALTALTGVVFPDRQTLFFVPADLAFEARFARVAASSSDWDVGQRMESVGRTFLLYGVVAPKPLEVIAHKDPRPTLDFKTYEARTGRYASYDGLGNLPLGAWLIVVAGGLLLGIRGGHTPSHSRMMLALLACLAFNAALHLFYGTELFLYTPNATYALVLFLAMAYSALADRAWLQIGMTAFGILLMLNNLQFLLGLLRAASPFFAAAY